jgi:hypothetical protein
VDQELRCDICQTFTDVNLYAEPFNVVRCLSHNPFDYRGESNEDV